MQSTTLWLAEFLRFHKKNILWLGPAALLLSLAAAGASAQTAGSPPEPTVWAHKVSWTSISNLNHTSRRDFPLGMGQPTWPGQPHRDGGQILLDNVNACALAQSAGIDAFALDIFPSGGLNWNTVVLKTTLDAAAALHAENGKPFSVSPCLDSPTQYSPSQTASLISGLVANLGQRPEWPKFNGVPIVWTYNATGAGSAYWQQVFSQLHAQNVKVDIILDAASVFGQATSTSLPTADLNAYAALPVALYSFGGETPGTYQCRQYLAANFPNSLATALTIGTVRPGYWNESTGGYQDPQGTAALRNGFASAASSRWVTVTTWDDYGENTQVEPSVNMGTGRLDVLHALIAERDGQSWPATSRFYLWQPSEVHDSGPVTGEALALVPDGGAPATLQVNLCDSAGNVLIAGSPQTFTTAGINALPYSFTLPQMPAGHCAYLSLVCGSADTPRHSYLSEPVKVWPTDNPWRTLTGLMWQAGTQFRQSPVTLSGTGLVPELDSDQFSGFSGQLFPLINSNLVAFPAYGSSQFSDDLSVSMSLGPDSWDTFAAVPTANRWGFFDAKGVNPDGTLHWSTPVWVEPAGGYSPVASSWHFDEGTGTTATDSSLYANTVTLQGGAGWSRPGQSGASCLALDGGSGCVSIPQGTFPTGNFTFAAQVKPILTAGQTSYSNDQFIFCDIAASLVLRIRADGRLQAQRTDGSGWETATGTTVVPANQWSLVTVTYDQQMLRLYYKNHLEAIVPCTGTRISAFTTLGSNPANGSGFFQGDLDEVQIQASVAPPAGSTSTVITPNQMVNVWHFNEGTGTVANNATPYSVPLTLQNGAGWTTPGQTGAACALLNGTTSRVAVPDGCFPTGSFTFTAQIKPTLAAGQTSYPAGKSQDIFCDLAGALTVFIRSDGRLQAQRTDSKGWETAYGTTVVPANQWLQVTVTYDQQMLKLYYKNHLEAQVACTGTHSNANTVLGCNSYSGGCDFFHGNIDEVQFQPQVVTPAGANTTVLTPDQQVNLWHFDEAAGTVASNATPYGIFLTLPSTVGWSTPGQTGASCLLLNGTGSQVSVPNGSFPHGSFTFTAQVKPALAAGVTGYPAGKNQDIFCDPGGTLTVFIKPDGRLQAQRTDSKGWETAYGTTVVPANQWSQVTVTYDQQRLCIYLGSHFEGSVACTGTHTNANTVLGCNPWNGGCDFFQGNIDEVGYQPNVVVPGSAPVPPPSAPATNLWHFDEGTGTVAANAFAGGTSLALMNGADWTTPGQSGAACLLLNGTTSRVPVPNGCFPHGAFTFTAQIKPTLADGQTKYTHYQQIFCDFGGALVFYVRTDGILVAQRTDSKGWETAWGTSTVPANQWSQVTASYDGSRLSIYLGSHFEGSVACTGTHTNANTALGCNPWNGGCDFFQGNIDEVQF